MMPDIEKVIKGLECRLDCGCMQEDHCNSDCPYLGDPRACRGLDEDALALMRAQEPHLVTEADYVNSDSNGYIPAWCEVMEKDGTIVELGYTTIRKEALNRVPFNRYWTSCPTNAQREVAPWHLEASAEK